MIELRGNRVTDPTTTCPVCKVDLRTQAHDLEPHRQAVGLNRAIEDEGYRNLDSETNRLVEQAIVRHPAGKRRHRKED